MGLSLSLERGHEGCICEVLQEDCCSSMNSNYYALLSCNIMYSRIVLLSLHSGNLIRNVDVNVKLNHDSHEFILESGTVANTNSTHCLKWRSTTPCIIAGSCC
jgi:hypothetical protein